MHFTSTSGGVRFGLAIKLQNSGSFHPELDFLFVQKDIGNGNRYARYIQACLVPHSDMNAGSYSPYFAVWGQGLVTGDKANVCKWLGRYVIFFGNKLHFGVKL